MSQEPEAPIIWLLPIPQRYRSGAYEIGTLISYGLFGVTTTQTYIYYSRFPDDSRKLKGLIAFVWICELAHALCIGHTLYVYTISGSGHPAVLLDSTWTLHAAFVIASVTVACVQSFFGFRIYVFSKKLRLAALVWVMAFSRLAVSSVVLLFPLIIRDTNGAKWELFFTSAWSVGVANDLLIPTILIFLLRRLRADVPQRYESCILTSNSNVVSEFRLFIPLSSLTIHGSDWSNDKVRAVGIAELISLVKMEEAWIWIAIFTIEARMFSNSFLASLNGRTTLRAMGDVPLSFAMTTMEFSPDGMEMSDLRQSTPAPEPHNRVDAKGAAFPRLA
ncbi:hypothetical protein K438DRAFT_1971351 [Mycena galopus ATCC 62051]|nr:hypothetical protein K438DRAFT_1971351 [Mycena galopus ATCC 62051]